MNGTIQAIILTVVIAACSLGVIIGVIKTIGKEYRKTSDYAADMIYKTFAEIPETARKTMEAIDRYQEEKADKIRQKAWEEEKRKNPTMSCKDEAGWGIM